MSTDSTKVTRYGPPVATSSGDHLVASSWDLIRSQWAIAAVLMVWAFAPLVAVLIYVGNHGGVLTGLNGGDYFDQFQYLAWIRDEGTHFLASNLWQIGPSPHDYLQPMYVISGLLWQLGASIQVAYLIWKPVAVLVLFLGFAAYCRHMLPESRVHQGAALFLAIFYMSPALALAHWTGIGSPIHTYQLVVASEDARPSLNLWGFDHTAIAIGLVPVFLIAADRLLAAPPSAGRSARSWTMLAAAAGLLVAWLHPWQALILLGIVGGMFLLRPPRRRYMALIVPVVATLLPMMYSFVLTRSDASWSFLQSQISQLGTAPVWALLLAFGPLVGVAALGLRLRSDRDWMLALWLVMCVVVYLLFEWPPHALSGITLPLAVLAVRGWSRLRLPNRAGTAAGIAAILAFTVPAAVNDAQGVSGQFGNTIAGAINRGFLILSPNQASALAYLSRVPRPGGVLAPAYLSSAVPGFTGRSVYGVRADWAPVAEINTTSAFFDRNLNDPGGAVRRAILRRTHATFVLADCGGPPSLAADIALLARPVKRFGCDTVYETTQQRR